MEADAFLTRLSRSAYASIDAFLEHNPEYISVGKFLMARELKKCEDINQLFPPNDSGWYQYLFESLMANGLPEFGKNRIGIITFNYDRSLECYLHNVLMNRFKMSSGTASETLAQLPLIHVHGILGQYPTVPYDSTSSVDSVLSISKQIQIVHEISESGDEFCSESFERAHGLLQNAERIYFLGFGFHATNIGRMRFFRYENVHGRMLRMAGDPMYPREREWFLKRMNEYGFDESMTHDIMRCNDCWGRALILE